ncbi:MAG: tetratricopeptide repeat protein [Dongiaceae bacterium]
MTTTAPDPILARAMALHRAGKRTEAEPLYRQAAASFAEDPRYHYLHGLCLLELGKLDEGIAAMADAVRLGPRHPGSHYALGRALALKGTDEERAAGHLRTAIAQAPAMIEAHLELGNLLARRDDPAPAFEVYKTGLAQAPDHPGLAVNYANLLYQKGDREEAVALWERMLQRQPNLAAAHSGLGIDRRNRGDVAGAEERFRRALAIEPRNAECRFNLGVTLRYRNNYAGAIEELKKAIAANPRMRRATMELARCYQAVCAWQNLEELDPALEQEFAAAEANRPTFMSPFFSLSLRTTEARRLAVAKVRAAAAAARAVREWQGPRIEHRPGPRERLTIGYISSDLRDHPAGHLLVDLFGLHDRERFAVHGYSIGPNDGSSYRKRFERDFDRFVDLGGEGNAAAARRIADDRIDILVDLNGMTALSRPEIAALRPAPVQATWLGLPGTTGADFFDYALTDRQVTPDGSARHFTEALCMLPDSYYPTPVWPFETAGPADRVAEGLPPQALVLCCFCAHYKIERTAFERWMGLMRQLPGAVLWLLGGSPEAEWRLLDAAEAAGVPPRRIVFAPRRPKAQHLARLALADLMLDTFTYGGHTTASDALAMGVPVVTCWGDAFASRVGVSLLTAVGLPELIAETPEAYGDLVLRLGQDPAALAATREKLAASLPGSSLFDPARFARNLERAYCEMWRRQLAGEPPGRFEVADLRGQ